MTAPVLILDLQEAMIDFRVVISDIDGLSGMCDCGDCLPADIIRTTLEYMADRDTALGCLEEYVAEIKEIYHSMVEDEKELDEFAAAVLALGKVIYRQLCTFGAYDAQGALWYQLKDFMGDDLLLQPIPPEKRDEYLLSLEPK